MWLLFGLRGQAGAFLRSTYSAGWKPAWLEMPNDPFQLYSEYKFA